MMAFFCGKASGGKAKKGNVREKSSLFLCKKRVVPCLGLMHRVGRAEVGMKPQRKPPCRKANSLSLQCQTLRLSRCQISGANSLLAPSRDLLRLPLYKHVWFCWPLRESHGTSDQSTICITDHTSRRALGTSVGMMMMVGKAGVDDSQGILELVQRGMRRPMTTSSVWGKPRRPTCIVIDGLLTSCLDEMRSHLAALGITVLQGRSAIGEAHSDRLHACGGAV